MILASRPRSNVEKKINLKSFDGQNSNEIEPYDLRPFLRRKSVVALNFSLTDLSKFIFGKKGQLIGFCVFRVLFGQFFSVTKL